MDENSANDYFCQFRIRGTPYCEQCSNNCCCNYNDIHLKPMTFEKKQITFDNQEIFNKLYSLTEEDRITNEDIKKVGNDIVIYNKKKQKKIENILKKVDYDFHK